MIADAMLALRTFTGTPDPPSPPSPSPPLLTCTALHIDKHLAVQVLKGTIVG